MSQARMLLPDEKIEVFAEGEGSGRFIQQFRYCWSKLPSDTRQLMLNFWRNEGHDHHPLIEFSHMWCSKGAFAQVTRKGMEVRFNARSFAEFPDSVAHWIIAHELAHVYQKALGKDPGGQNGVANEKEAEVANEQEANDIAISWGFERRPRIALEDCLIALQGSLKEACAALNQLGIA